MVKIYDTGEIFLSENEKILEQNILETSFFIGNSKQMKNCDKGNYIIKIEHGEQYLFLLKYSVFSLLLYGDIDLCEEAVNVFCEKGYTFEKILAPFELGLKFLNEYEKKKGGSHRIHLSMDIMYAEDCNDMETPNVRKCSVEDIEDLVLLHMKFSKEALHTEEQKEVAKIKIEKELDNYYGIRKDNRMVSIAKKTRQEEKIGSITNVYTLPEYRGTGLAREIVTHLTANMLEEGKIPYLYVDKTNPISNHLYSSIGYKYGNAKVEFEYKK